MENKSAISSDLIRGHIDTIILHTLLDSDKFAQQISESVKAKSDGQYEINQATLYSSLKRLENLKYVTGYWHDTINGRRRYFKLTDAGKTVIDANLSDWSFSRSIIDKLIDVKEEPKVVFVTTKPELSSQNADKSVERSEVKVAETEKVDIVGSAKSDNHGESVKNSSISILFNNENSEKNTANPPLKTENTDGKGIESNTRYESEEERKDLNFRNILSGLIKIAEKNSTYDDEIKSIKEVPTKNQDRASFSKTIDNDVFIEKKESDIPKFNETVSKIGYKNASGNTNCKIDFGDLSLDAQKCGYKLRISSKDARGNKGNVFVNKVNFISSLGIFLLLILELLAFTVFFKNEVKIGLWSLLIIPIFCAIPVVFGVVFYKNPKKTIRKISADTILTAFIILFNLILITFAITLLLNVNLHDKKNLICFFIVPATLYADAVCFFILRYFVAKNNSFKIKAE